MTEKVRQATDEDVAAIRQMCGEISALLVAQYGPTASPELGSRLIVALSFVLTDLLRQVPDEVRRAQCAAILNCLRDIGVHVVEVQ